MAGFITLSVFLITNVLLQTVSSQLLPSLLNEYLTLSKQGSNVKVSNPNTLPGISISALQNSLSTILSGKTSASQHFNVPLKSNKINSISAPCASKVSPIVRSNGISSDLMGTSEVDSTTLNNLAVALQLLLVNNILKNPSADNAITTPLSRNSVIPVSNPITPENIYSTSPLVSSYLPHTINQIAHQLSLTQQTPPSYIQTLNQMPYSPQSENYLSTVSAIPAYYSPTNPTSMSGSQMYPAQSSQSNSYSYYAPTPATNPLTSSAPALSAYPYATYSTDPNDYSQGSVTPAYSQPSQDYYTYSPDYQSYYSAQQNNNLPFNPNVNFVGASNFVDSTSVYSSYNPTAPKLLGHSHLLSPYDAVGPNSPFKDPILSSPYGSIIMSKHDFQSPYATILTSDNTGELYPISDLF